MPAPNAELNLGMTDAKRASDWILWVYPAAPADRVLNHRLCEWCEGEASSSETSSDVLAANIGELGLGVDALLSLEARGVQQVSDLVHHSRDEVRGWAWVSDAMLAAIEETLASHGLRLGMPRPTGPASAASRRGLPISASDAETILRWFTYLPMHSRTAHDRRIAATLAGFLGVPLTVFEDHEGETEHDEATFDIVDDDPSNVILGREARDDEPGMTTPNEDLFADFSDSDDSGRRRDDRGGRQPRSGGHEASDGPADPDDEDDPSGDTDFMISFEIDEDDLEDFLDLDDDDDDLDDLDEELLDEGGLEDGALSPGVMFELDADVIDSILDAPSADPDEASDPGWQPEDPDAWKGAVGGDDGEGWKSPGMFDLSGWPDGLDDDPADAGELGGGTDRRDDDDHDIPY